MINDSKLFISIWYILYFFLKEKYFSNFYFLGIDS